MNELKIKNNNLVSLTRWLNGIALPGKESRVRTRFVELASEHIADIDEKRIELLKQHAKKDDKGEPILIEDMVKDEASGEDIPSGTKRYDLEDQDKFKKEFDAVMEEEFVLDVTDGHKDKCKVVRDIILNTNEEFSGPVAKEYETWCAAFEVLDIPVTSHEHKCTTCGKDQ